MSRGLTKTSLAAATADIWQGLHRAPLWLLLGSQEIRQRYRRSRIGPFWLTISMGVLVAALGLLYGTLFGQELDDYLPYLAAGFVIWGLMSALIQDGAKAFIDSDGMIQQLSAPLSIYVYRVIWSNLLIFAHNIVVFVAVVLWFGKSPGWVWLAALPGVALIVLNGLWFGLLVGLVSARFRDVPQILASVVQVMFFVTPILWSPAMLPERTMVLGLNPFYHYLEIVRGPLLGQLPSLENWFAVVFMTLVGWVITLVFYANYRWRISYWV